jgi:hypothetical protein
MLFISLSYVHIVIRRFPVHLYSQYVLIVILLWFGKLEMALNAISCESRSNSALPCTQKGQNMSRPGAVVDKTETEIKQSHVNVI